jgi:CheY-like chemotaxis protein
VTTAAERTVLVADDVPEIRNLVRSALERQGHSVLEAGSAAEVFELLQDHEPDVLLMDVHLGLDDGLAVGVDLRKEPRYADLKVVFMTGTMNQPELRRLSRQWNIEILSKPFDLHTLTAAVN